ncbi:thioredoxin family protein [Kordia algicida OT-1]|uniref:Thiol-disulfide isomerase or thioredoxin n=1 Tax=Kordia algicida OT-1 TaxID=391587 RepID=A9E1S3_9FLAO|nr:thioredoxin family protein [Kordia algicida]EDP95667.1 thiol-disulfide isomerase or thioredoxin [Kordia algicida OT-1]
MKTIKLAVLALLFVVVSCTEKKKETAEKTEGKAKVVAENVEKAKKEVTNGYQVGDIVKDFSLKNVDGKMVSMADYKDAKGFILTFTCNTCPYSVAYEDRLIALDKKYASKGYPVIAINPNSPEARPDDSFEKMQERAKEKGFTFPYMLDVGQKIYPVFGATRTPHMYVLAKTDKGVQVKYIGAIDDNYKDANAVSKRYIEDAVDALLAGKEVEVKTTKAIGCSIKV